MAIARYYTSALFVLMRSPTDRIQRDCKQSHAEGIVLPVLALSARNGHSIGNYR